MKPFRIEEPCHEDWTKMNPTQQGAFCSKCEIDVVDFSRLNLPEIKSVLKDNYGKHICGRFDNKQLVELNIDFQNWQNNNSRTFQSKFVYALLLVFGLTLFSCSDEDAKQIANMTSIEMQAALTEPDKKIADQLFFHQDAIIADEMISQLSYDQVEYVTMGQMISYEDVQREISYNKEDISHYSETRMMGAMVSNIEIYPDCYNYLNETDSASSTLPQEIVSTYNPFETKVYPNPTRNISNLSLYINEAAQFTIEVYSISGQRVAEIFNGELSEGRQNFEIDFFDYAPGNYFVKVWSEKQDETMKVIRVE